MKRKARAVAPGVTTTSTGYRVFVRVRVARGQYQLLTKRFPKDTALKAMADWRHAQHIAARGKDAPPAPAGTFAEDVQRYLEQVAAMPTLAWRKRDLEAWQEPYGGTSRRALTTSLIRATLHRWRTEGPVLQFNPRSKTYTKIERPLSASACNHRRTALLHLFTILDGKGAPNPVKDVAAFSEPLPEPRGKDLGFLLAAIGRIRAKAHQARASVLLWTGMRGNSELGRMREEYVDLEAAVCHVPTGKGGKRFRTVPLNENGIAAWRTFAKMKLWGKYDKNLLLKSFRRACVAEAKARGIKPAPRVRIYDLRHSIATAYLKEGADLSDVQLLLGHSTTRMTRRYAPFQSDKLAAVGKKLERVS